MLMFIDESGHDHGQMPCEVLAGAVISEDNLWNLVKAIRAAEHEFFGDYLHNLLSGEIKAKKLLKRKRFRIAEMDCELSQPKAVELAHSLLLKGKRARLEKATSAGETRREMIAYSRQVLAFVHEVLNIAANHNVEIVASVVDIDAPRPAPRARNFKERLRLLVRALLLSARMVSADRARTRCVR